MASYNALDRFSNAYKNINDTFISNQTYSYSYYKQLLDDLYDSKLKFYELINFSTDMIDQLKNIDSPGEEIKALNNFIKEKIKNSFPYSKYNEFTAQESYSNESNYIMSKIMKEYDLSVSLKERNDKALKEAIEQYLTLHNEEFKDFINNVIESKALAEGVSDYFTINTEFIEDIDAATMALLGIAFFNENLFKIAKENSGIIPVYIGTRSDYYKTSKNNKNIIKALSSFRLSENLSGEIELGRVKAAISGNLKEINVLNKITTRELKEQNLDIRSALLQATFDGTKFSFESDFPFFTETASQNFEKIIKNTMADKIDETIFGRLKMNEIVTNKKGLKPFPSDQNERRRAVNKIIFNNGLVPQGMDEETLNELSKEINIGSTISLLHGYLGELQNVLVLYALFEDNTKKINNLTGVGQKIARMVGYKNNEAISISGGEYPVDTIIEDNGHTFGIQVKNVSEGSYSWSGKISAPSFFMQRAQFPFTTWDDDTWTAFTSVLNFLGAASFFNPSKKTPNSDYADAYADLLKSSFTRKIIFPQAKTKEDQKDEKNEGEEENKDPTTSYTINKGTKLYNMLNSRITNIIRLDTIILNNTELNSISKLRSTMYVFQGTFIPGDIILKSIIKELTEQKFSLNNVGSFSIQPTGDHFGDSNYKTEENFESYASETLIKYSYTFRYSAYTG